MILRLSILNFLFCLLVAQHLKAQDTLILNDGNEMHVKVLEIAESTISYKKTDNPNGPSYTTDISKVFMAVYKDGKRETFKKDNYANSPQQLKEDNAKAVIHDNNFEVQLIATNTTPDKKNKFITISADIDAYANRKLFTKMSLSTQQSTNSKYPGASTIIISALSEKLQNFLWEKYENYSGKGYRWDLPPDFFSLNPASCSIKFYQQKSGNREILGFGGLSFTTITLKDCLSLENKLLSVALTWLETNFGK